MLVVIDTNVFISAVFKSMGNPANIVTNVFNGNLSLALSYTQIIEIKYAYLSKGKEINSLN